MQTIYKNQNRCEISISQSRYGPIKIGLSPNKIVQIEPGQNALQSAVRDSRPAIHIFERNAATETVFSVSLFWFSICSKSSLNTVCVPHPLQSFYGACFCKSILLTLYFCCVGSIPIIRITIGKGVFPHGLQIHTKHLPKI